MLMGFREQGNEAQKEKRVMKERKRKKNFTNMDQTVIKEFIIAMEILPNRCSFPVTKGKSTFSTYIGPCGPPFYADAWCSEYFILLPIFMMGCCKEKTYLAMPRISRTQ